MDISGRDSSMVYNNWNTSLVANEGGGTGTGTSSKKEKKENSSKEPVSFTQSAKNMAFTGPLNLLIVLLPFALVSYWSNWPDAVTFILALLALAPLAERLGYVTEQLALHTNETIGGLLNATFGNATELIVAISALSRGLFRLVQLSLLGSILSNMLLVLGCAFFCGGLYHKVQKFGTISSQVNSTLLLLSTMAIMFPTILSTSGQESNLGELGLSRATSFVLFGIYFAYLYFQLKSHKHLYEEDSDANKSSNKLDSEQGPLSAMHNETSVDDGTQTRSIDVEEEEEEEDELGFHNALFWLAGMTVLIALLSDAISASIQDAADSAGISGVFISAIILPIVGNAAEHAGAVMFAIKGKLDLSLGVAIGSSTQIALCVLPLLVIIGWMMDKEMTLNFGGYECTTLLISVVSVTFAIKDGQSNWLVGATLIGAYCVIALGFWAHVNEPLDS